jgi:osmotically-inducible protein OsmY
MKDSLKRRSFKYSMIAFGLLLSTGCASLYSSKEAEGENPVAVATSMKVKEALIKELEGDAAAIQVESTNGHVQLSGFADNETVRQKAVQAAEKVPGVATVINNIQIR